MIELELENGNKFCFDETRKYQIYFGANAIGKTLTTRALDKYLKDLGNETVIFDDKILEKMLHFDKEGKVDFLPNIAESSRIEAKMLEVTDKYSFKAFIKNLTGNNTQKYFSGMTNIVSCIQNDFLSGGEFQEVYNADNIKEIFKLRKNKLSYFDFINKIDENDFSNLKKTIDLEKYIDPEILRLRKEILDDDVKNCPVCLQSISEEQISLIKINLNQLSCSDEIKECISFVLKDATLKGILIDFINTSDNFNEAKKIFLNNIEQSVLAQYKNTLVSDDVTKYNNFKKQLDANNSEISKLKLQSKSSKEKNKVTEYLQAQLNKTKIFGIGEVNFNISKGVLTFDVDRPYEQLSKSEQDFLKFLYFNALIMHLVEKNNVSIIIDDPFDSYDEPNIDSSISIICNAIVDNKVKIDYCQIFSHSLRIFNLHQSICGKEKTLFNNLIWLDKVSGNDKLANFYDNNKVLQSEDFYISDLWLVNSLKTRNFNEYSLICCSAILRELALTVKHFGVANTYITDLGNFYNDVSETIIKNKRPLVISDLSAKFNTVFSSPQTFTGDETIEDKLLQINSIFNETLFGTTNNEILSMLCYKYLLILKMRRMVDKKIRTTHPEIANNEIGKMVKSYHKNNYSDLDKVVAFFDANDMLLNDCGHLLTRSFSPLFNIKLETIQQLYSYLISIL